MAGDESGKIVGTATGAIAQPGVLRIGGQDVVMSQTPLNVVYFDGVPGLSFLNGVVGVTLVVTGNVPNGETVINCASVVAHLKCNIPAAIALRDAINSALLLAQPVEKPEGPAN